MSPSDLGAWIATALVPLTAAAGWLLRLYGRGPFASRMKPHLALGYAALALGTAHGVLSMGNTSGTDANGIALAFLALVGLGVQAFLGLNLQSPGAYRMPLRRWHTALFWGVAILVAGHIILNAPLFPQMGAAHFVNSSPSQSP